ncbi:hypothetical protein [Marinagarivorans cellulosilyticus]|uniref:hypothetical protein n=1 Tax=Marinagarivorans cellulosilyticus TaxID=2721545 RepID=UPI001F190BAC|nr:hypothetical protein [Marinagarivorans cellulosilyticus]
MYVGKAVSVINLCQLDPTVEHRGPGNCILANKIAIVSPQKVYKHSADGISKMQRFVGGVEVPYSQQEFEEKIAKEKLRTVYIPQGRSNCQMFFEEGEEYLIFSKSIDAGDFQMTSICDGSGSVEWRKKMIEELELMNSKVVKRPHTTQ